MHVLVINVTSDKDLTGQARKMGRTAGLKSDGTLDSVNSQSGIEHKEGTLVARTVKPDIPDAQGLDGLVTSTNAVRSKN